MVSELVESHQTGTAITLQFCFGFIFTVPGMYLVPFLVQASGGWALAWLSLAPGSFAALLAVLKVRFDPAALAVATRLGRPSF